jgi:hypothetical protein
LGKRSAFAAKRTFASLNVSNRYIGSNPDLRRLQTVDTCLTGGGRPTANQEARSDERQHFQEAPIRYAVTWETEMLLNCDIRALEK